MTDEIAEEIYYHFEDEGKYEENPIIPYIFNMDMEIPIKDSVIERFIEETPNIMIMSDFLRKKLWPPVRSLGSVYKILKPIPFGYDLEVQNIELNDYIIDANSRHYKKENDTDNEDLSDEDLSDEDY